MCKLIPEELVIGAIAFDALLYVKVSRKIAEYMLAQRLETEQLLRAWLPNWKQITGWSAITITVEWERVMIVKGKATVFRGDVVTFRGQS